MDGVFVLARDVARERVAWGERGWISRPTTSRAEQLVVIDVQLDPGGSHDFHKHPAQEEVLFLISGSVEQWVGRNRRQLAAGDACFIPPGVVHGSFNGAEPARLLAVLGPCVGDEGLTMVDVSGQEPWASLR